MHTTTEIMLPEISGHTILDSSTTNWFARLDIIGGSVDNQGTQYTAAGFSPDTHWIPAILPGTLLNTLLHNKEWVHDNVTNPLNDTGNDAFYDPYFDNNITRIPDMYDKTNQKADIQIYTYWYFTSFKLNPGTDDTKYWLNFRGINYTADVFVNEKHIGEHLQGAFLRHSFDLTKCPTADGITRIAVRVVPPDPPGIFTGINGGAPPPNGYGESKENIGHNVTMRYPTGWDWIPAIPDRSTGIWDQVSLAATKALALHNPHVITTVLDKNGKLLKEATVEITTEVINTTHKLQEGFIEFAIDGKKIPIRVSVAPNSSITTTKVNIPVSNPRLWWPNGNDPAGTDKLPCLYDLEITAYLGNDGDPAGILTDSETVRVGLRQVGYESFTTGDEGQSHRFLVNGIPVFIKGGNWVGTDALFRFGAERYRDEVRMHREMNLNMIRVWGGGIAERPEFYDACDEMGILVMQDFWFSGEFQFGRNGNTEEPSSDYIKAFKESAIDTIKMLRNHPSLLFWCGANETKPPASVLTKLQEYIKKPDGSGSSLDSTRVLVPRSTAIGNTDYQDYDDGPYDLQEIRTYFTIMKNNFNPECGAVGFPVVESMQRMMKEETLKFVPENGALNGDVNKVFQLHDYTSYKDGCSSDQLYTYAPENCTKLDTIEAFSELAQLANYFHDKEMWEGVLFRMWTSYTGFAIWKTQNPWAGLRSAVYDWYLEQTGAYWGVKHACEPVHVQLDLSNYPTFPDNQCNVLAVNQTQQDLKDLRLQWEVYDLSGKLVSGGKPVPSANASAATVIDTLNFTDAFDKMEKDHRQVYFLFLVLLSGEKMVSRNFYWLSRNGEFHEISGYRQPDKQLNMSATGSVKNGQCYITVNAQNTAATVSFWNRLQVTLPSTGKQPGERILPVYYDNNYFSVHGNRAEKINLDFRAPASYPEGKPELWLKGLHQNWQRVAVKWE